MHLIMTLKPFYLKRGRTVIDQWPVTISGLKRGHLKIYTNMYEQVSLTNKYS